MNKLETYFNTNIGTNWCDSTSDALRYWTDNYNHTMERINYNTMYPPERTGKSKPKIKSKKHNLYEIKKIVVNTEKGATTVIFTDGTVEVVKKSPEDPEADIFSVVAYAVAKRVYGSNSAFKREVVKKVEVMKFKEKERDASIDSLRKFVESLDKILKGVKK